jgi:MFS family permease
LKEEKYPSDDLEVSFRQVLRNKDFTKLLAGQFFSNFGDNMFRVVILLHVYSLTGDLSLTTLVLGAQIAPWIIFGPIAGVLADRFSRKLIMVVADIIRTIGFLIFPFLTEVYQILIVAFIIGIAAASFTAPRSAAIPEITGVKLYVKAITLSQLLMQTMAIVGPLAGALIYVALGRMTFWFGSFCFLASGFIIYFTLIPSADRGDNDQLTISTMLKDLKEGISYLLTEPVILKLNILFGIIIIGGTFASTLVYPYLFDVLYDSIESQEDIAQSQFGAIGALTALGSILGNLAFGKFERGIGRPTALFTGSTGMGIFYLIFIFTPSFQIIALVAIAFGFCNGMSSLAINAIFAETVPNEIRGRAYSATIAYMQVCGVLSISLSGYFAEFFGIVQTIVGAGLFITLSVLIYTMKTGYFKYINIQEHLRVAAD